MYEYEQFSIWAILILTLFVPMFLFDPRKHQKAIGNIGKGNIEKKRKGNIGKKRVLWLLS